VFYNRVSDKNVKLAIFLQLQLVSLWTACQY